MHVEEGKLQLFQKTTLVISPKSKRYDKHQRTIALFREWKQALAQHFEVTGSKTSTSSTGRLCDLKIKTSHDLSPHPRSVGSSDFPKPVPEPRLSAANDICRDGFTMKVVTEWFGHDMATALKHYHQVMPADLLVHGMKTHSSKPIK